MANAGSRIMMIGPQLVRGLGVKETEIINMGMDAEGVDGTPVTIMAEIPVKFILIWMMTRKNG